MTEREALKLALEFLEQGIFVYPTSLATAIKEALAQPDVDRRSTESKETFDQQEPVAITITGKLGNIYSFTGDYSLKKGDKVYTTPPQRKPWAALTEQEHTDIAVECGCMSSDWVFYGATVERLLKEKNS